MRIEIPVLCGKTNRNRGAIAGDPGFDCNQATFRYPFNPDAAAPNCRIDIGPGCAQFLLILIDGAISRSLASTLGRPASLCLCRQPTGMLRRAEIRSRRSEMPASPNLADDGDAMMHPNILFDTLNAELGLADDADLSRYLEIPAAVIHDVRCQLCSVSPDVIIVINERTGMPVHKIRAMIAIEPVRRT